jgi:hypothetical protein
LGKRELGGRDDSPSHLNLGQNPVIMTKVPIQLEHGTPTISVEIEGMSRSLIIDTGSNISILQPGISKGNVSVTPLEPYGVTGNALHIRRKQRVTVVLNGRDFTHSFLLRSLPTAAAGLVGTDFMNRLGAIIDFECSKLTLTTTESVAREYGSSLTRHSALNVFPEIKEGSSLRHENQEQRQKNRQIPNVTCPLTKVDSKQTWVARATENITVPPRCWQIVTAKLDAKKSQD